MPMTGTLLVTSTAASLSLIFSCGVAHAANKTDTKASINSLEAVAIQSRSTQGAQGNPFRISVMRQAIYRAPNRAQFVLRGMTRRITGAASRAFRAQGMFVGCATC